MQARTWPPLQLMKDAVDRYPIAAWKCYTQWGPKGSGFELDSPEVGIPFIERARELGVRNNWPQRCGSSE